MPPEVMVYPCGAAAAAGIAVTSVIAMAIIIAIMFFMIFFIVFFPFFLSLKEGYIIVCNNNMSTQIKNKKRDRLRSLWVFTWMQLPHGALPSSSVIRPRL